MILAASLYVLYSLIMIILITTYFCYPVISKYLIKANKLDFHRSTVGFEYVIIPAYNEENVVKQKVLNTLQHLEDNGKVIVVSDASKDKTDQICMDLEKKYDKVQFYVNTERGGKNTCLNFAINKIDPEEDDILIFTDCNTFFDDQSLPEIRKSLMDGASLAAGSMVYNSMMSDSAKSEGLYWRYEEWIRRNESEKGRLIVCNGGLFGMWADYYETLQTYIPNDLEIPLRLCGSGKFVMINPKAKGIETAINSPKEEYARKERMANRQMNCILHLWKRLDTRTRFQVLFHKLFRWYGLHLFILASILILIVLTSINSILINILFFIHLGIIFLIILSWSNQFIMFDKKILPKILHAIRVHYYGAKGSFEAIFGRRTSIWEKAETNR